MVNSVSERKLATAVAELSESCTEFTGLYLCCTTQQLHRPHLSREDPNAP